jgi:hypothetical protein
VRPDHPDGRAFNTFGRGSFSGSKRPEHKSEHLIAPNAKVKDTWSYISPPPLHAVSSVKHRDNFTFEIHIFGVHFKTILQLHVIYRSTVTLNDGR